VRRKAGVTAGCTRVARRAGMRVVASPTPPSSTRISPKAGGSAGLIPNRKLASWRGEDERQQHAQGETGAQPVLPEGVADHHHWMGARRAVLLRQEGPPARRPHS
jgi:hypothetical protein